MFRVYKFSISYFRRYKKIHWHFCKQFDDFFSASDFILHSKSLYPSDYYLISRCDSEGNAHSYIYYCVHRDSDGSISCAFQFENEPCLVLCSLDDVLDDTEGVYFNEK